MKKARSRQAFPDPATENVDWFLYTMTKLIIVGSGSQARYAIEIAAGQQKYTIAGIADLENPANIGKVVNGHPIVCMWDQLSTPYSVSEYQLVVAIGNNRKKRDVCRHLAEQGYAFATLVSRAAYVAGFTEIGQGTIINPMAAIMPNAKIGNHVIVHSQAVVEHDNLIGNYVNIAPGVSLGGNVSIGEGAYIYTGASVIPKKSIGDWAVVGAGALVLDHVPDGSTVVGVPAKAIH